MPNNISFSTSAPLQRPPEQSPVEKEKEPAVAQKGPADGEKKPLKTGGKKDSLTGKATQELPGLDGADLSLAASHIIQLVGNYMAQAHPNDPASPSTAAVLLTSGGFINWVTAFFMLPKGSPLRKAFVFSCIGCILDAVFFGSTWTAKLHRAIVTYAVAQHTLPKMANCTKNFSKNPIRNLAHLGVHALNIGHQGYMLGDFWANFKLSNFGFGQSEENSSQPRKSQWESPQTEESSPNRTDQEGTVTRSTGRSPDSRSDDQGYALRYDLIGIPSSSSGQPKGDHPQLGEEYWKAQSNYWEGEYFKAKEEYWRSRDEYWNAHKEHWKAQAEYWEKRWKARKPRESYRPKRPERKDFRTEELSPNCIGQKGTTTRTTDRNPDGHSGGQSCGLRYDFIGSSSSDSAGQPKEDPSQPGEDWKSRSDYRKEEPRKSREEFWKAQSDYWQGEYWKSRDEYWKSRDEYWQSKKDWKAQEDDWSRWSERTTPQPEEPSSGCTTQEDNMTRLTNELCNPQKLADAHTLFLLSPSDLASDPCKTIKKVFLQMALKVHPDKNPGNPSATPAFQNLDNAKITLSKPEHYNCPSLL